MSVHLPANHGTALHPLHATPPLALPVKSTAPVGAARIVLVAKLLILVIPVVPIVLRVKLLFLGMPLAPLLDRAPPTRKEMFVTMAEHPRVFSVVVVPRTAVHVHAHLLSIKLCQS